MKKTLSHTPTYTWTETHHITIWLPDLPVGPEQPNQSSAGRTAMTMHNGWTKKRRGRERWKPCAFSSYVCRLAERGDSLFFLSQQREKVRGRIAWCNTTKWLTFPLLVCQLGIWSIMSTGTPSALCGRWQKGDVCSVLKGSICSKSATELKPDRWSKEHWLSCYSGTYQTVGYIRQQVNSQLLKSMC